MECNNEDVKIFSFPKKGTDNGTAFVARARNTYSKVI